MGYHHPDVKEVRPKPRPEPKPKSSFPQRKEGYRQPEIPGEAPYVLPVEGIFKWTTGAWGRPRRLVIRIERTEDLKKRYTAVRKYHGKLVKLQDFLGRVENVGDAFRIGEKLYLYLYLAPSHT